MTTKPKPTPSETVKMVCKNKQAGKVGTVAHPPKSAQKQWEAAGWAVETAADDAK